MRWFGIRLPFGKRRHGSAGGAANGKHAGKERGPALSRDMQRNVEAIIRELGNSSDLTIRAIRSPGGRECACVVYINGIVNLDTINQTILDPILQRIDRLPGDSPGTAEGLRHLLTSEAVRIGGVKETDRLGPAVDALLGGYTLILVHGSSVAFEAATRGGEKRSVDEPSSQTVTRGPKECFTEDHQTNVALLRRRIKSPLVRVESLRIGRHTQTDVDIVYMQGIAKDSVVQEVRQRLGRIDVDSILESGYIEEFIQDGVWSPFPTIQNSERPDAVAASILEGQVAIIVDGSPFVLCAPVTFVKFFQSSEDYYQRYDMATFLRIIRMVSFLISMLLPALYIAITTFHQEMLPTPLLISLAAQREGVPFPALVEGLLMEVTFEVLREAGVRMPKVIGPAISIVGALVLGQAAVQAGLVSAAMIIVVSFTAIANFVIPALNMAIAARLIRFGMMLLAGTLGLFGIMSGLMVILIHLVSMRSFGVPYMTPFAPLVFSNLKDVLVRVPWWAMNKRPKLISSGPYDRQEPGQKPEPRRDADSGRKGERQ